MGEGITTDFSGRMSYGDYLGLDQLLSAQKPLTGQHDELLFIIIHQVQELWLKLMLHELELATDCLRRDELRPAFKATARVSRIQRQLIEAWDVLTTMTPHDYLAFRESLGSVLRLPVPPVPAAGVPDGRQGPLHDEAARPPAGGARGAASGAGSALDLRRGAPAAGAPRPPHPRRGAGARRAEAARVHPAVVAAWAAIYGAGEAEMDLYELAEELVDLEDSFGTWRFRHMRTVERIIGHRRGTGGSAGVSYLKAVLERRFFPELYEARTAIA